ncbi:hypothetical protein [Amycolatopsis sp. NPDC049868]|uniref:hypothetical protein n=1 Tax=Amycolatopsis sp. NPDC049868 TaxID=3363934 RepID=UPI003787959E
MKAKHLRALSSGLIRDLDLDPSATTEDVCGRLCEVMAVRLGEPVNLRFDDLGDSRISGMWVVTEDRTNVIIVAAVRSWMHRLLILLHEVAHMLCGHRPPRLSAEDSHDLLFPDLSPTMLLILASRTDMCEADEREADKVAGALTRELVEWADKVHARLGWPVGGQTVTQLGYSLGFSHDGSGNG